MQFFLQAPLLSLPDGSPRRGEGLLQLFYCSRDDGDCETWRPFSGTHLARLVVGATVLTPHPPTLSPFPSLAIETWRPLIDYPHPEEHESLGLVYDYDFPNKRVTVTCPELDITLRELDIDIGAAETIANAELGDKLGGWPAWVQSAEYPACPQCGEIMELVLQVDSEDNIPHMFGDMGCGHITQCPRHPSVLTFGWACS